MATIDKPLPNTKTTVEVPGEVEIEEAIKENIEEIQEKGGPVEIEITEEGGAEVYRFYGPEGDYSKDIDEGISGGIENLRKFTKKADGGEVNLTIVRMPDISESGVESLFKRR